MSAKSEQFEQDRQAVIKFMREREKPIIAPWTVAVWVFGMSASHSCNGYFYRHALKVLHSLATDKIADRYLTSQNESFYYLTERLR